jgi:hypothetical protein
MANQIVTGEKIQQLCDLYFGFKDDFDFNPIIQKQTNKHFNLNDLTAEFNNPLYIFCYSHRIKDFSNKIQLLKNEFVLITHNSDGEIRETHEVLSILNSEKVLKWHGQNVCFEHPKLHLLPIGLANSQWPHGNLTLFNYNDFIKTLRNKTNKVYFNFSMHTNPNKRQICYDSLVNKLQWLNNVHPIDNLIRLSSYEFCICPEGNGSDSHRLWECLYLKVVPIVIESEFTKILQSNGIPIVILHKWDYLDCSKLNYNNYNFDDEKLNKLLTFTSYYLDLDNV